VLCGNVKTAQVIDDIAQLPTADTQLHTLTFDVHTTTMHAKLQTYLTENKAKLSLNYVKARIEDFRSQGLPDFIPSYIQPVAPPKDNYQKKISAPRVCAICEQKAGKTCVKCKSAHYCCKEHQVCATDCNGFKEVLKDVHRVV
jgi:hypothetical protein